MDMIELGNIIKMYFTPVCIISIIVFFINKFWNKLEDKQDKTICKEFREMEKTTWEIQKDALEEHKKEDHGHHVI